MKRIFKNDRGIALFLVLWVMALLSVIAGEFCHAVRTEVNITRNFKEETQAYYIASSGVFWAIGNLVASEFPFLREGNPEQQEEPDHIRRGFNVDIPAVDFGKGRFKVEKENESGKVNLNKAGHLLLKMMLNSFEIEDDEKDIIVDSIMDWRDKNSLCHANGAENDYYLSLPVPYKCKNDDFSTIDELLLVRGVTPEIFYGGLKEMVSVYQDKETSAKRSSRQSSAADFNKININAASPRMLRSLPGMTDDMVLEITEYRNNGHFRSLSEIFSLVGAEIYAAISSYITLRPSSYYTINSTGMVKESRTRQGVQAVVKIDKALEKGYEIIQWIDGFEYR